jgi:glycosyltransferase involved in cell wall biosynthesis
MISVVTPTYEPQAQYLSHALKSILGQSYTSLEAVVVHDGSARILEIIDSFRADKRLKAYRETGRGYISALNQGIELSDGGYVAFCDSDDLLNKDHLKVLHDELERHPEAGLAFDNLAYLVDSENSGEKSATVRVDGRLLIPKGRATELAGREVALQEIFKDNLISGPAFMVRKRVFTQVGFFDQDAFLLNDLHFFYRVGAYFPVRYVDYLGVRKRVHAGNLTVIHRHYEYGVKCLENIRERYPEVYRQIGRRVFSQKLGRKYYRLGLYYERHGNKDRARESYKKAILTRSLSLRNHFAYLRLTFF